MRFTAAAAIALCAGTALAQTVQLEALSTGAMQKMGGYRPQRLTLSTDKPATITKAPADLAAPLYGVLAIGPNAGQPGAPIYHVIVDEPEGKDARLFVDANGNGDLTDDPTAEWKPKEYKDKDAQYTMYNGGATVELKSAKDTMPAHLGMYRFDKRQESRAAFKDIVFYYSDYARQGDLKLGDKSYHVMLTDDTASGTFGAAAKDSTSRLMIDVNANGKFDSRGESFSVAEPFNIGGTTWELADIDPLGASVKVVKSDKKVAEIPLPPDHSVGKPITAFDAKTMDGKTVHFPSSYKGKTVMIDFWATWCHPCMEEVPGLAKVYKDLHPSGFDILGITLDDEKAEDKIKSVTAEHEMTWPQVYDGKGWKARIAEMYVIHSIPAAFLVDGDSGEILAAGQSLRGEALRGTVEKALAKKRSNQKG